MMRGGVWLERGARGAIFVLPAGLVAVSGGAYLVQTLQTLLAPGVGFSLELATPKGAVRISARSYAMDPLAGVARLSGVKAVDESGRLLARADGIRATGLRLLDLAAGGSLRPRVFVESPFVRLRRTPEGKLDLPDFFPPSQGPPSDVPFEVVYRDGAVEFQDLLARGRPVWRASSARGRVRGRSGSVYVDADARVTGIGSARLDFAREATGAFELAFRTPGLDGARVLAALRRSPERRYVASLREASVETLRLTGSGRITGGSDPTRIRIFLRADAGGIRYRRERIARATFDGFVSDRETSGRVEASDGTDRASFAGRALYGPGRPPRAAGRVVASFASLERLRPYLPANSRDARVNGAVFDGYLAYDGKAPRAQGALTAASASVAGYAANGLRLRLALGPNRADVRLDRATVSRSNGIAGIAVSGSGTYDLAQRRIVAFAKAPALSSDLLRRLTGRTLPAGLVARGSATFAATGPLSRPSLSARSDLAGSYRLPDGRKLLFSAPVAFAGRPGGGADGRAIVRTDAGTFAAVGGFAPRTGWDLLVSARGVGLRQLDERARGRLDLSGRVTGPLADPRLEARAEGVGVGTSAVRVAGARAALALDRRGLRLRELRALKGAGAAKGSGEVIFASPFSRSKIAFAADARGLQLSDFAEGAAGTLDIPALRIGGTVGNPTASGRVRGRGLVAAGERVPLATSRFTFEKGVARLPEIRVQVAGGEIVADARYDVDRRRGEFSGEFSGIKPGELTRRFAPQANLGGSVAGRLSGTLDRGGLLAADVTARADDLAINGVALGSGPLQARLKNRVITAEGEVGLLARYFRLNGFKFGLDDETLGGTVEALGIPIAEVVGAARPFVNDEATRLRLFGIEGSAGAAVSLSGKSSAPVLRVESLTGSGLAYGGVAYGDLSASGTYANGSVILDGLKLDGPQGIVQAAGVVGKDGTLDLRAEGSGVTLQAARPFVESLPSLDARLDSASFVVVGTTAEPVIRGSLFGSLVLPEAAARFGSTGAPLAPAAANRLALNLFDVRYEHAPDGAPTLSAKGLFSAVGFTGDLSASAPIGRDVAASPVAADLVLRPRKLSEVASYFPGLTISGPADEISGSLSVRGTPGDLVATGSLAARAGEIAYGGVATKLRDAAVTARFADGRVLLDASATSSYGGSFALAAGVPIADLLAGKAGDDPLARDLRGTLRLDRLRGYQTFEGGAYVDARATTPSPIVLGGTLRRPSLSGGITVESLDTILPTLTGSEDAGSRYAIEPTFDLTASIADSARVRTTAADVTLGGGGTASGRLSDLRASADLVLRRGTLRLPGGTVRLDPGGTLALRYDAAEGRRAGGVAARLDTELTGRTQITALRTDTQTERYDVTLEVRGDLLAASGTAEGLSLTARSDPPDLSQDRILRLLGQTDIVTGFLDTRDQRALQNQLRSALTGYALPTFFGGFTNALAREFGLDYVNLDYNAFEGASVAFARTLGAGLTFSGRRQLSAPQPGLPQRYDVRLGYRPRRGGGYLRSLSVSLGADEIRPYKLSLEYGIRLGRNSAPLRTYRLGVKD